MQHPPLYQALLRAARRFIGGESLTECVSAAKALNAQGHAVTIDYMGESTRSADSAEQATQEFRAVIRTIVTEKLNASVSLDLSHLGMVIDVELAYRNMLLLAQEAQAAGVEIMISMEGSDRTSMILDLHRQLTERFENVGVTLQAYQYRTPSDLSAVLARPGKLRIVKGAYGESPQTARARGTELDAAYRDLVHTTLSANHTLSVASHDPALLDDIHRAVQTRNLPVASLEFEMLKGVTPERLALMQERGYRTRVYLPYGHEWYLYLCNRLAEYPLNIYQAIADAVAGQSKSD